MTNEQWNALKEMDGMKSRHPKHPEYGLIVGKLSSNKEGLTKFVIMFRTDQDNLQYGYVLKEDDSISGELREHLRTAYDAYLKQLSND